MPRRPLREPPPVTILFVLPPLTRDLPHIQSNHLHTSLRQPASDADDAAILQLTAQTPTNSRPPEDSQQPQAIVDDSALPPHPDKSELPLNFDINNVHNNYEFQAASHHGCIRGRLRDHISFWRGIGASQFILSVISNGYYLPLKSPPQPFCGSNHQSAFNHASFVNEAISELLTSGSVLPFAKEDIVICSPLGVVEGKKLRLILDLRHLNEHIETVRFRYDDIKAACSLFDKGDYFFVFDLKSADHHIDMDPAYYKYLGFEWARQYYAFASLPFGLCSAPYVFTKVCRALVKHWRSLGFKIFMYLDDGAGAASSRTVCEEMSSTVRSDLLQSGFLLSEKSRFQPVQQGELLGFVINLEDGHLSVAPRRVERLFKLLHALVDAKSSTARKIAQLAGTIISMGPALGPITRLRTREMYRVINSVPHINCNVILPQDLQHEMKFWQRAFLGFQGVPIRPIMPATYVITWSDASDYAWGGYTVSGGKQLIARGSWPAEVLGLSSTLRELRATRSTLESLI